MDYLRQLSNDEKRSRCAVVATIRGADMVGPLGGDMPGTLAISTIPAQSVQGKVYAVVTEAFASGSTLDWGRYDGLGDEYLQSLSLTSVGSTISTVAFGSVFTTDTITSIVPNASALSSVVGEVKLVVELTEAAVKSGKFSA